MKYETLPPVWAFRRWVLHVAKLTQKYIEQSEKLWSFYSMSRWQLRRYQLLLKALEKGEAGISN